VPSDVQNVVVTYCCVSSATNADVIVVAEESVERSMVLLPTTTRLLELPDSVLAMPEDVVRGTAVLVTKLEVMVLPEASVVVIGMVVRILVDDTAAADSEDDAESEAASDPVAENDADADADAVSTGVAEVSDGVEEGDAESVGVSDVVGPVVGAVVGSVVGSVVGVVVGSVVVGAVVEDCKEEVVVGSSVLEVVDAELVVVTPVPTACLLLGIMPAGISLALICAKPAKRENMTGDGRI